MRKHNKKIVALALTVLMAIGTASMSFARTPDTLEEAKQDILKIDGFKEDEQGIYFTEEATDYDGVKIGDVCKKVIGQYFRGCAVNSELLRATTSAGVDSPVSTTYRYTITDDDVQKLIDHQKALDEWSEAAARRVVPDGVAKKTAAKDAYWYITYKFPYDYAAVEDTNLMLEAQSAYYCLENGKGICASQSKLFRCLVEAIPLNPETGLVDWNCAEPDHLQVYLVKNDNHQFAAIRFEKGDNGILFYECTGNSKIRTANEAVSFYNMKGIFDSAYTWEP